MLKIRKAVSSNRKHRAVGNRQQDRLEQPRKPTGDAREHSSLGPLWRRKEPSRRGPCGRDRRVPHHRRCVTAVSAAGRGGGSGPGLVGRAWQWPALRGKRLRLPAWLQTQGRGRLLVSEKNSSPSLPVKRVSSKTLLPDHGSYRPGHEVRVILGTVAHEVAESKLPGLPTRKQHRK